MLARTPKRGVAVLNQPNIIDAAVLLHAIPDQHTKLTVFDPQYRGNLDTLKYGNEGARQKARTALPQMSDDLIEKLLVEICRITRPSGHMMLWVNKHTIGTGGHLRYLRNVPKFRVVDLLAWHDGGFGMGYRFRGCTEYLIMVQKEPTRAKGIWLNRGIRDFWVEAVDRSRHPHAKPHQLTETMIRCMTKRGDLVVDPCAGGYGVLDACRTTGRNFLGGDLIGVGVES